MPLLDQFSLCFELLSCNKVDKLVSFAPVEPKAAKHRSEIRHTFKFQTRNQEARHVRDDVTEATHPIYFSSSSIQNNNRYIKDLVFFLKAKAI